MTSSQLSDQSMYSRGQVLTRDFNTLRSLIVRSLTEVSTLARGPRAVLAQDLTCLPSSSGPRAAASVRVCLCLCVCVQRHTTHKRLRSPRWPPHRQYHPPLSRAKPIRT